MPFPLQSLPSLPTEIRGMILSGGSTPYAQSFPQILFAGTNPTGDATISSHRRSGISLRMSSDKTGIYTGYGGQKEETIPSHLHSRRNHGYWPETSWSRSKVRGRRDWGMMLRLYLEHFLTSTLLRLSSTSTIPLLQPPGARGRRKIGHQAYIELRVCRNDPATEKRQKEL